jgi:hypothetical protein
MNFDLSEEQQLARDMVGRFLGPIDVQARHRIRALPHRYDREGWTAMAELGLLAMAAPQALGGMGSSMVDLVLVTEALGHGLSLHPWLENGLFPLRLAVALGDAELTEKLVSGAFFVAVAFAEQDGSNDLIAEQTRADDCQISGRKSFVCGASLADIIFVTLPDDRIAIAENDATIWRQSYPIIDGSLAAQIDFADTPARVLPLGAAALQQIAAEVQLIAAGEMLGLAQMLFDHTLLHVRERRQFGVPIGSFQALQHRLAHSYALIEQMRSLLLRTAMTADESSDWQRRAAGSKAYISEGALHIGREAVQMHGGMGQSDEMAITHAYKRLLLLDKYMGDQQHCLSAYARAA